MTVTIRAGAPLAEHALAILEAHADHQQEVAATGVALGELLNVHPATAARALVRLVETGALHVVRRGGRDGPTRYRITRPADEAITRDVPTIAGATR